MAEKVVVLKLNRRGNVGVPGLPPVNKKKEPLRYIAEQRVVVKGMLLLRPVLNHVPQGIWDKVKDKRFVKNIMKEQAQEPRDSMVLEIMGELAPVSDKDEGPKDSRKSNLSAVDTIKMVKTMTDKADLEQILGDETRKTVQDAVRARLMDLEEEE